VTLGGTANATVDALKGQPLLLVVVILNVLMLFMVGYAVRTAQENTHVILKLALEKCGPTQPQ
jgi:hypothetical protein